MKILYYRWEEYTYTDAVNALQLLGHDLTVINTSFSQYDEDEIFIKTVSNAVRSSKADLIFSFNYFPDLSRVAMDTGILYYSWCYDSPLLTLESKTLPNPCNRVFLFDHALYENYRSSVDTVFHLPLACDPVRLEKITKDHLGKYEHDITFLGNMYADENDFYSRIKYLPEYVRGFLDCVMEIQMKIYGTDIISESVDSDMCEEIAKYAQFDMGSSYNKCKENVIRFMIQKQTTVRERFRLMTVISEVYKVDHYSNKKCDGIKADYKGYADYMKSMPVIFATSRINLNITLRSILSGIPLRVIDILGSGGFCLTNYQPEISQYFVNDESIVWYESYEDMFSKLDYYLRNDSAREKIAARGHKIVADEFTYEKRFTTILSHK